ncbi:MAG: YihY/virulence factor BrkB family protein [Geminicoccaceae bacterium]|nr:YihY/virulence factor BrkB family protein [Geminicoccaceae bacterium]
MRRIPRWLQPVVQPPIFAGKVLWDAIVHFANDNSLILAGYIAYMTLFAMFPFLIFLTTVGGVLGQGEAASRFVAWLLSSMPSEVARTLAPSINEIMERPRTGLMTASIVVALWVASSGLEALRSALNEAYNAEQYPAIWKARLQSLGLTILFTIGIIISMIALVAGPFIWAMLEWALIIPSFYGWLYGVSRYVFGVIVLYGIVVILYFLLPNRSLRKREVFPGAALAVGLWVGSLSLFSFYLSNMASYSVTYGSLGGIVVTLLFFYVSACIFIFGAEVNAALRRREVARRLASHPPPGSHKTDGLSEPGRAD